VAQSLSKGRSLRKIALALGLALVAFDASVSLFLLRDGLFLGRPLPPFGALTHPKQRAWLAGLDAVLDVRDADGIGRFDSELGWDFAPSSTSEDGAAHTNALAARGTREYATRPPPGAVRILTFGDSFTFGDEIEDARTFQRILENRRPDAEVLNFGVSGYGTDQALLRYRRLGRSLGARVVCIGILLENIGRNVNRYRPLWNPSTGFCSAKPRFRIAADGGLELLEQPFASQAELKRALEDDAVLERIADGEYWLGRPCVPTGRASSLVRLVAGWIAYGERSPERLWLDVSGEPFRTSVAILEAFHREALADGAAFAPVLVFPAKEDLRGYLADGRIWWRGLVEQLERRAIPCLDLVPALAARERELEADPTQGTLYFGGHLSSVGNAVVATELERLLVEAGALPRRGAPPGDPRND